MAQVRGWRSLSQKQLAEELTKRGFRVDAPAVSRIEKGSRAVRLSEALIIADVLDVELASLLAHLDNSPRKSLKRARDFANHSYRQLRDPLLMMLSGYVEVYGLLQQYPELLSEFRLEEGERLAEPNDYFSWAAQRIASLEEEAQHEGRRDVESDYVPYSFPEVREGVQHVVAAYVDALMMPGAEWAKALPDEEEVGDGQASDPTE